MFGSMAYDDEGGEGSREFWERRRRESLWRRCFEKVICEGTYHKSKRYGERKKILWR